MPWEKTGAKCYHRKADKKPTEQDSLILKNRCDNCSVRFQNASVQIVSKISRYGVIIEILRVKIAGIVNLQLLIKLYLADPGISTGELGTKSRR